MPYKSPVDVQIQRDILDIVSSEDYLAVLSKGRIQVFRGDEGSLLVEKEVQTMEAQIRLGKAHFLLIQPERIVLVEYSSSRNAIVPFPQELISDFRSVFVFGTESLLMYVPLEDKKGSDVAMTFCVYHINSSQLHRFRIPGSIDRVSASQAPLLKSNRLLLCYIKGWSTHLIKLDLKTGERSNTQLEEAIDHKFALNHNFLALLKEDSCVVYLYPDLLFERGNVALTVSLGSPVKNPCRITSVDRRICVIGGSDEDFIAIPTEILLVVKFASEIKSEKEFQALIHICKELNDRTIWRAIAHVAMIRNFASSASSCFGALGEVSNQTSSCRSTK